MTTCLLHTLDHCAPLTIATTKVVWASVTQLYPLSLSCLFDSYPVSKTFRCSPRALTIACRAFKLHICVLSLCVCASACACLHALTSVLYPTLYPLHRPQAAGAGASAGGRLRRRQLRTAAGEARQAGAPHRRRPRARRCLDATRCCRLCRRAAGATQGQGQRQGRFSSRLRASRAAACSLPKERRLVRSFSCCSLRQLSRFPA